MTKHPPEYPHPMQYACPDCKGKGTYQGIGPVEDCKTCMGAGSFIGVHIDLPETFTHPIVKHPYPKETTKEDWDKLAEAMKTNGRLIVTDANDVTVIKGKGAVDLQVGEPVHVFDSGWFDTVVDNIFYSRAGNQTMARVSYACGTMQIPIQNICWNITDDRWEYIRSGTPVW